MTNNDKTESYQAVRQIGAFTICLMTTGCFYFHSKYGYEMSGPFTQAVLLSIAAMFVPTGPLKFGLVDDTHGKCIGSIARMLAIVLTFALSYIAMAYLGHSIGQFLR